jgi:RNA polymerase sigma-70 factor (ECF subfamily)
VSFLSSNKYQELADAELVFAYKQQQNTDALGAVYQRYMDLIYGVCIKYLKDRELAKDAVLNIYEELVHKLQKHEVDNFRSWLYTLAKNHCLMYLRSPKNKPTKEFVPEVMHLEENVHLNGELEDEANFDKLEKCMQTLVNEQQKTVKMFYYEQKCYKEISDLTGFDVGMVRSYIQNGRRNLKICMEKN